MIKISVSAKSKTLNDLLKRAKRKPQVLESADGDQFILSKRVDAQSFYVGDSNDFEEEVKMTRKNKKLMKFLAERHAQAKGKKGTPLEAVRRKLGLEQTNGRSKVRSNR